MTVSVLNSHPDRNLTNELSRFEAEFSYPLGDGGRFQIAHDGDGWRFFHAMGEAAYAVAWADGRVQGVLGASLRHVVQPDGSTVPMVYVGDLKVAAEARGGMTLIRLVRAIQGRFQARTRAAFSVVMDGTAITPAAYTGRMEIPAFAPLDVVSILWLRTDVGSTGMAQWPGIQRVGSHQGLERFRALAAGCYHLPHAEPTERSVLAPQWLMTDDGAACGRLEDTQRAKRLRTMAGKDMLSAHLSCFAYRHLDAGLRLLRAALDLAAHAGYPMVFVAVNPATAAAMCAQLGDRLQTLATATVFGTGLTMPGRWNINTAEI